MKEYASTIIYICIFAIILELILPDNKLKKYVGDADAKILEDAICRLLDGAYQNCSFDLEEDSILQNGSEMYHNEAGIHKPIIYGDYFYTEAVYKLINEKKNDMLMW